MKILWKNVWYNLVGRRHELFLYYRWGMNKSIWRCNYYPHLQPWTKKQEDHLYDEFNLMADDLNSKPPMFRLRYPRQQPNTAWQGKQDDPNDQRTEDTH